MASLAGSMSSTGTYPRENEPETLVRIKYNRPGERGSPE